MKARAIAPSALAAALVILPAAVFGRLICGQFLNWDDWRMVATNPDLRPDHWPAILQYWYQPHLRLFIPLTYSVYAAIEWAGSFLAGGAGPGWFHATSILIHITTGLLLWRLLIRLFADPLAAAIGAGLFLLHPIQVEAVAWIASLNTVLSGCLAMLAINCYVSSLNPRLSQAQSLQRFIAACIATTLAMLAKPAVCGLPIITFVLHLCLRKDQRAKAVIQSLLLSVIELPMIWIVHQLQAGATALIITPLSHRPLVMIDAIGCYLIKLLFPIRLAIDYGRAPTRLSFGPPAYAGAAVLLLLAILLLFARRFSSPRIRWCAAGLVIFLAGLLPVLGWVPFDFQFYSTVADRYLYLSMLGPALIVASLLAGRLRSQSTSSILLITCSAILLGFASISFLQAGTWMSDNQLFGQALRINLRSIVANQTLGFLAAQAADRSAANPGRQNQFTVLALDYDDKALAVDDNNPRVHFNRGNLLLKANHPELAVIDYSLAAGKTEDEASLQNNWGIADLQMQINDQALGHFQNAARINPKFPDAYANAGIAYENLGQPDQANAQFQHALTLDPHQPQALRHLSGLR
jgi:tetratricopeptide (TPR) repeat protein